MELKAKKFSMWIRHCFWESKQKIILLFQQSHTHHRGMQSHLLHALVMPHLVSLHMRMWETICDAWACWSGWNIQGEYSYSEIQNTPQNENCQRVQIWEFQNTPPMKIVRESKSESFRIPPQNENCQRVQIRDFQNTPPMKIVRESKSKSFRIPPQKMKIVRESKSKSFRIPPCQFWKTSDFKLQNSFAIREIVCGD